jgi:tetratricopeptide (TPR) repeat protein
MEAQVSGREFQPRVRPSPKRGEAQGWLIAGEEPREWLRELSLWDAPVERVGLFVMPRSAGDPEPMGVFAIGLGKNRPEGSRAMGYRLVADKVFVPEQSELFPPMSEAEIRESFVWETGVLHPTAGLVGFEAEDRMSVGDLLQRPLVRASQWDRAMGGAEPVSIRSVKADLPGSIDEIIEEGRGEIGKTNPDKIERIADEPTRGPLGAAGRAIKKGMYGAASWVAGMLPDGPAWARRFREWSKERLGAVTRSIEWARNREIERLKHLLQTDPDRGLNYALPISGPAGRGWGAPGIRLTRRNVRFSLSRLGGGGPIDPWNLHPATVAELSVRYRALANREMELGRHRRAAYILAELLGDYMSAAGALRTGKHYVEAAEVYRRHLKLPQAAAECLQEGGLLLEAAELLEEAGELERAGDLLAKVGRRERAVKLYRRVVESRLASGDVLSAAEILQRKLESSDEALGVLGAGWPSGAQAGACLVEQFGLLGRLGRHEEARRRIEEVGGQFLPPDRVRMLADAMAQVVRSYPMDEVRERAADAGRVAVGRRLIASCDPAEAQKLLGVLPALDRADRLLKRDASRYAAKSQKRIEEEKKKGVAARPRLPEPRVEGEFRLLPGVKWSRAVSTRDVLWVSGVSPSHVVAAMIEWESGAVEAAEWKWFGEVPKGVIIAADSDWPGRVLVHPAGKGGGLVPKTMLAGERAAKVGGVGWIESACYGLAFGAGGTVWVLSGSGQAAHVSAHTREGALRFTCDLRWFTPEALLGSRMAAVRDSLYVSLEDRIFVVRQGEEVKTIVAGRPVKSLSASEHWARPRVAATFDEGGAILPGAFEGAGLKRFGDGLCEASAAIMRGGRIVAVDAHRGRVYEPRERGGPRLVSAFLPEVDSTPLEVVAGASEREFAVIYPSGQVMVYRMSV